MKHTGNTALPDTLSGPPQFDSPKGTYVSFIIPAFNEELHIGRCLSSIGRLEIPAGIAGIEIIVVDNRSTDNTAKISRSLGAKIVSVLPGRPSRARNAGARAAMGDWLAFIDADCALPANWLAICGASISAERSILAVAGAAASPGSEAPWFERCWHDLSHGQEQNAIVNEARWLPSFNLLVLRSAFESVGGFDETLITCEDCDLGYKLAARGKLIADPRTRVTHLGRSQSLSEFFCREAWRSRGNLRLAMLRPLDWTNWASLLLPLVISLAFLISVICLALALASDSSWWPGFAVLFVTLSAITILVCRKTMPATPWLLLQRWAIYITYIGGRTAGIMVPFARVKR